MAVVGHTNTGKTSLIRTLLRNRHFGEVRNQPGTTRHVESARVHIDALSFMELRDTPGLEDSSALKQHLDTLVAQGHNGRDALQKCIDQSQKMPEFEQEIKVLKQILSSQILLYIIDCREPVFEKYLDELNILKRAAIPILPVLNFIHHNNSIEQWKTVLAQLGLHAQVEFDTVAFDFKAEKRLYNKLQTLVESHYALIEKLLHKRTKDWQNLHNNACKRIAHLMLDAVQIHAQFADEKQRSEAEEKLQGDINTLEKQALQDILELMQFDEKDIQITNLPISAGQWKFDLFSAETLKHLGLDTASSAATGAAIGVGVDLALAGLSFGIGTASGALIGALWHNGKRFKQRLLKSFAGAQELRADDITLDVLFTRQVWLLNALFHRGHAACEPATNTNDTPSLAPKDWTRVRNSLKHFALDLGPNREQIEKEITALLQNQLQPQELNS